MSWFAQSGRDQAIADSDANDTWDKYVPQSHEHYIGKTEASTSFSGPKASSESVVKAFASSNAMAALNDPESFGTGHKTMRLQNKQHTHDAHEQNILPVMATSTLTTPETYFLGWSDALEREKGGKFVDRLGNEFDIYESKLPPPNKDYSSCAADSSNRHLERCQGGNPHFTDRPKKEVRHVTNPAEPRGDGHYESERRNVEELKGRQTYFNKAGMQPSAVFDTGRDQYDGYNVKTDYKNLVHEVEPTWRATMISEQKTRSEPTITLRASPSAEVYLRRTEGVGTYRRKPIGNVPAVRAGQARITLPYISEATPRSTARCEGSERQAAHVAYGSNATARVLDTIEKPEAVAIENKRAEAGVAQKSANPVVVVERDDARAIEEMKNGAMPLVFTASLTNTTRNDTERENAMVVPKPSRDWHLIQKMMEDVDRQGNDDAEVEDITKYAATNVEGSMYMEADTDHLARDDVVENTLHVTDVAVAAGNARLEEVTRTGTEVMTNTIEPRVQITETVAQGARLEEVTRFGQDAMTNIVDPRTETVVHASPRKAKRTRTGRDNTKQSCDPIQEATVSANQWREGVNIDDDRTVANDIHRHQAAELGDRVEHEIHIQRGDVFGRDDARPYTNVPLPATKETVTIADNNRQQDGQSNMAHRDFDEKVRSDVSLSTERTNYTVKQAPVREVGDLARPNVPINLQDRATTDRAGLAVCEVADVIVRPRNDALVPDREAISRPIEPLKTYDKGDRLPGEVSLTRYEKGLSRINKADAVNFDGAKFKHVREDRPAAARTTYGNLPTTKNQMTHIDASMRVSPKRSSTTAGLTSTCRIDSNGTQTGDKHLTRPESGLKHDRSTPTRALTPGLHTNARWTPTLQQNGRSRDTNNTRAFTNGDTRIRTSTPDMRGNSARDATPC